MTSKPKRKRIIATPNAMRRLCEFSVQLEALCDRLGFDLTGEVFGLGIVDRCAKPDLEWPVIAFITEVRAGKPLRIKPEYKELD